ncbi:sigma-70 family RNA polymerase sigma factor [Marinilabiliaceae bacterium JC017]|nr:sigma-70 family RNA polymerase sigma factor [Marinilabiliaceae bacterium JC017]
MKRYSVFTDDELVKGFVAGDSKCIDALIDRHSNKIFTYIVVCVKHQALAEDIFQDAIIRVIKTLKAGKYQDNGRFSSWVMRIAHNLIIDHYRKQKHLATVSNDDYDYDLFNNLGHSDQSVETKIVYEQILSDVDYLVSMLPDAQREVIEMRHYKGLSFKEIADETNVSINTALGRMRYALINLRKLMEEKNISLAMF